MELPLASTGLNCVSAGGASRTAQWADTSRKGPPAATRGLTVTPQSGPNRRQLVPAVAPGEDVIHEIAPAEGDEDRAVVHGRPAEFFAAGVAADFQDAGERCDHAEVPGFHADTKGGDG